MAKKLIEGNKILICGNGGSAADAQHIAAELVGRFNKNRPGLCAIALTSDTSLITAVSNDYNFDDVFARQVEALGKEGDILLGISTSGNSKNVIKAFQKAGELKLIRVALLGKDGGQIFKNNLADYYIIVPLQKTRYIQEAHIIVYHEICEIIENKLFGSL